MFLGQKYQSLRALSRLSLRLHTKSTRNQKASGSSADKKDLGLINANLGLR